MRKYKRGYIRIRDVKEQKMLYSEQGGEYAIDMNGSIYNCQAEMWEFDKIWMVNTGLEARCICGNCNAVEIFAGDIIYVAGVGNCVVEIKNGSVYFGDSHAGDCYAEGDVGQIVGNIFQTPDLIPNGYNVQAFDTL